MRRPALIAALAAAALAAAPAAEAGCTVSASGLSFGVYNPMDPQPRDSTGHVQVRCDRGDANHYVISLRGAGPGGRKLRSGTDSLTYQIYLDAGRTQVAGDGSGGGLAIDGGSNGSGGVDNYNLYGRIPAGQVVAPGAYTDVVTVVVTY